MNTAKTNAYALQRLVNAEKMFAALSALPEGKQQTVTMVANAFMEGMKAQEQLARESA